MADSTNRNIAQLGRATFWPHLTKLIQPLVAAFQFFFKKNPAMLRMLQTMRQMLELSFVCMAHLVSG